MAKSSNPSSIMFINSMNTGGAPDKPKGMTKNSKRPLWHAKAVFSLSLSSIRTCQYPDFRSSVEKYLAFPNLAKSHLSQVMGRKWVW